MDAVHAIDNNIKPSMFSAVKCFALTDDMIRVYDSNDISDLLPIAKPIVNVESDSKLIKPDLKSAATLVINVYENIEPYDAIELNKYLNDVAANVSVSQRTLSKCRIVNKNAYSKKTTFVNFIVFDDNAVYFCESDKIYTIKEM